MSLAHDVSSTSGGMASNYFLRETSNQIVVKVSGKNEGLVNFVMLETSLFSHK